MPTRFTLTAEQRADFDARGFLRLRGFYPPEIIAPMANAVWADLAERLGLIRGRPETWTTVRPAQFQRLTHGDILNPLGSADLRRLAAALLGEGAWTEPRQWGQPLVTFPSARPDQPRPVWHFDVPGNAWRPPLPGLRFFTFLEPTGPGGGGTLYVAGAHRLALEVARTSGPLPSAVLRRKLAAAHPWVADLIAAPTEAMVGRVGETATVGAVPVAIEEMTGDPGDLILMHPLMLHGVAHNRSDRVRMMVAGDVWRR